MGEIALIMKEILLEVFTQLMTFSVLLLILGMVGAGVKFVWTYLLG